MNYTLVPADVNARVADGIRTHDLRNHNPTDSSPKLLTDQQVALTDADGCTNGCTNSAEDGQLLSRESISTDQTKQGKLLATSPELLTIVTAWPELTEAVKTRILAMVRSSSS